MTKIFSYVQEDKQILVEEDTQNSSFLITVTDLKDSSTTSMQTFAWKKSLASAMEYVANLMEVSQ